MIEKGNPKDNDPNSVNGCFTILLIIMMLVTLLSIIF